MESEEAGHYFIPGYILVFPKRFFQLVLEGLDS